MTLLLALYAKGESPMILKLKTPALLGVFNQTRWDFQTQSTAG
jgi:hypothetical protein